MRFPDIEDVVATAVATFRRFPATLLSALIGCGIAMALVDHSGDDMPLTRALLAALLGIALMFAIESGTEGAGRGKARLVATGVAGTALVGFAAFSGSWSESHLAERFGQLLLAFHLLAAFAAFIGTREENGFWQFNRALFMRFWTATLFAGVLFAGLAIALRSIDALFGVDIDGENYARLWIFMAMAVHPWMFLSGVPKDLSALEEERSYPAALKVFAQFILVPLVTVYLLILSAYLVKVVTTQEWPSGWIGWLVSSVSAVGTLALLLVHPVREDEGNGWVRGYARWFWIALMPSIAMLFFAIGKRISQYGFTERRYFLLLLAVWIAVVAIWFAFTRSKRIRFIPVSLSLITVLSLFGPWGAYAVSERSQVARLTGMLTEAGATTFPVPTGTELTGEAEAARQVSDVLRYLYGTHSKDVVRRVVEIPAEVDTAQEDTNRRGAGIWARQTAESIGMRYFESWEQDALWANVNADSEVWPAPEETYQFVFRSYLAPSGGPALRAGDHGIQLTLDTLASAITVTVDSTVALSLSLDPLAQLLSDTRSTGQIPLPNAQLILTETSEALRVRVHIRQLNGRLDGETYRPQNGEVDVFLTIIEGPPPG